MSTDENNNSMSNFSVLLSRIIASSKESKIEIEEDNIFLWVFDDSEYLGG